MSLKLSKIKWHKKILKDGMSEKNKEWWWDVIYKNQIIHNHIQSSEGVNDKFKIGKNKILLKKSSKLTYLLIYNSLHTQKIFYIHN